MSSSDHQNDAKMHLLLSVAKMQKNIYFTPNNFRIYDVNKNQGRVLKNSKFTLSRSRMF